MADSDKFLVQIGADTTDFERGMKRVGDAGDALSSRLGASFNSIGKGQGATPDALKPYLAQLDTASAKQTAFKSSLEGLGVSAKQTAAAMRLVPAQFTDIVTGLASGQAPLTVLLQQGGQLKDMFGGVGAAAKGIGGYMLSLLSPINLAVAGAGLLALGFLEGRKESENLNKAIILTGNAAGVTVDKLKGMRDAVAEISGASKGAAADALGQLVASGQVASAQLQQVAQAAINLERAGGQAVSDTVKQFEELGKSPTDAAYKLNQQYHSLTAEIYGQIKALEDQGRKADAAALAQKIFAESQNKIAKELKDNLGFVEKAWLGVKDAAKGAWDSVLAVGREQTIAERIAELEQLAAPGRGIFAGRTAAQDEELARLKAKAKADDEAAAATSRSNKQESARIDWIKEGNKYLSQRQQIELESTRIRNEGVAAGIPEAEINRRIAKMRETYDQGIAQAISQGEINFAKAYSTRWSEYYTNELEHFRLSTEDFANKMAALERYALTAEKNSVLRQKPADDAGRIQQMQRLKEINLELEQIETRRQMRIEDGNAKLEKQLQDLEVAAGKMMDPLQAAGLDFGKRFGDTIQRAMAEGSASAERAATLASQAWSNIVTGVDFSKVGKEFDATVANMETRLADIELAFATNRIDAIEKTVGEKAVRDQISTDLEGIYQKLKDIAAASNDPEIAARLAEYERKLAGVKLAAAKQLTELDEFAKNAARGMQDALAEFLFDPFGKGTDNMAKQFGQAVQKMIAQAVAADLMRRLFGNMGSTGQVGGWLGDLFGFFGGGSNSFVGSGFSNLGSGLTLDGAATPNLLGWAKGGAFDNVPSLSAYSGQVVSTPTIFPFARGAGLMGEAGPEAILPLKRGSDGKLGVAAGSGGGITINVHVPPGSPQETRRAAGAGAREAVAALSAAQRYS